MQLDVFAHDLAVVLQESLDAYGQMYDRVLLMAPGSAVAEADLVRLRAEAGEAAERVALSVRYADTVKNDFARVDVDPQHNPQPVRQLGALLVENFLLLNRIKGLDSFASLPLSTPDELRGEAALPRLASWFDFNLSFQAAPELQPAPEPVYQPPPQPAPAQSPYPPIEPEDEPAYIEPVVADPVFTQPAPVEREEGWRSIDPPSDLPGDRHR